MLLIICILFLMYNLRYLRKGRILTQTVDTLQMQIIEFQEAKLNKETIDKEKAIDTGVYAVLILLFAISMLIVELITFGYLLSYDAYKWPTIFCIVLTLWQLFMARKSSNNWSSKEDLIIAKAEVLNRKAYTKYGLFSAIVHCIYYGYMVLVLTDLISLIGY